MIATYSPIELASQVYHPEDEKLIDRIERRFTPKEETVDELMARELTDKQQRAIELLVQGASDCTTAQAVGVHRMTIGRWRRYHPTFVAELNRRRDADLQAMGDRVRMLARQALEVLEKQIADTTNPALQQRAAIALLRLSGIGRYAQRVGETSADDIIEKRAMHKRKTERMGPVDHGEREDVLIDLARRADGEMVKEPDREPRVHVANVANVAVTPAATSLPEGGMITNEGEADRTQAMVKLTANEPQYPLISQCVTDVPSPVYVTGGDSSRGLG